MLEELESADVRMTMVVNMIPDPVVNAGRAGRDEYLKQKNSEREDHIFREMNISNNKGKGEGKTETTQIQRIVHVKHVAIQPVNFIKC